MTAPKDTELERVELGSLAGKVSLDIAPGASEAERDLFRTFASRDPEWVAAQDKRLVRKIDTRMMPCLIVMYLLNFLDRSNLAQARQGTLEKDLHMRGTDFNLATSIFFVGYLLMQLPSNIIITRVRPSIYLASAIVLWGVVSTCNAAAGSFVHLIVIRFFLGFAEAPFFPGAIFLMSSWYTRAELTRRVAWLYTGNSLANMFGGLISFGVLRDLNGVHGIAGWRWLFIVEGVATIGVGIMSAFILPDYPQTTRWLSDEERAFASWRLLADINEMDDGKSTTVWQGLKLALKDYRLYLFILLAHMSLLSQTFQYFFPSIVQTLGYDPLITLLLTVPAWFATFLVSITVNWTAAKTEDKSIHIFCLMVVAAAGNAIATGTTAPGARFFAMFLMPMGSIAAYTIIVGWVANSFPRPLVKRSAAIAIVNMIGNTASIYGSYMYNKDQGPQYIPGGSSNAAISFLVGVLALILRYLHKWENRKLERAENEAAANGTLTGRGPEGFRYIY
ncbi:MFS transporter prlL [Metarhizium brunneum]|uniref:MFS transporter prlL n=1 Tax=Metarhizium brunneum TaxID=500148 RepID=A0A7D5YZ49_9HYPO